MGAYKRIKTNISETILNNRELILIGFIVMFAGLSIYLVNDNQKLLEQVDEVMGDYNEVSYQYDLLNNSYEELKKEYERIIDLANGIDRYHEAKKFEEE